MNRTPTQIRHDYKATLESAGPRRRARRLPWPAVAGAIGITAVALMSTLLGAASTTRKPTVSDLPALAQEALADSGKSITAPRTGPAATRTVRQALALPELGRVTSHATDPVEANPVGHADQATPEPITASPTAPAQRTQRGGSEPGVVRQRLTLPAPDPAIRIIEDPDVDDGPTQLELVIQPRDTLDELFAEHGLNRADLARLLKLPQVRERLQMLRPGDRVFVRHRDGRILGLQRPLDEERTLSIEHNGEGFAAAIVTRPVERRQARAHGVIESSLFRAAQNAGISDNLIMNLAGIFAWDIDFVLDIRAGDRFVVVYEEIWQDGEKLRDGEILAAEFTNQGDTFRAIRFTDDSGDSGYFTPEGLNVKKAFLRAPIAITPRVTSNFNPRRLHPVHKNVRPHKGVDYGAPTGTPIKAAGDGKVIFRGRKGGYGNTVILQHGGNITTLYAHMSRFHNRSRVGKRVKQGQIIGYVGATGTVTARHLHYEYRVNGVHRNPRTVKLPKAQPVANAYRAAFDATATPLLQQLDLVRRSIRLAGSETQAPD